MRTRKFGSKQVSVLALGTSEFGGKCPEALACELMDAYAALDGNYIDTARVYGDFVTPKNGESEKVVGRWMERRGNREALFLSTKGGHPKLSAMAVGRLSRAEVRDDMARSLECLRTERVDIYWLHRDDESRPVADIMETMQSLIDDGMTKLIGASNWRTARIREANAYAAAHGLTPFCANQPRFSLARQINVEDPTLVAMDAEMYKMHLETGMLLTPFSSQAKGFLTKLDELGEAGLAEKVRRRYLCAENLEVYRRAKEVAAQTGLSVGAVALAYLTCQPFPTFPLVGASKLAHIEALREAGDAVITPEQRDYLRPM